MSWTAELVPGSWSFSGTYRILDEHQQHLAIVQGKEEADRLVGIYQALLYEVARLKSGDFTDAELQNLCHCVKDTESPQKFCDGCEAYQIRVFGWSPITRLRTALEKAGKQIGEMRENVRKAIQ